MKIVLKIFFFCSNPNYDPTDNKYLSRVLAFGPLRKIAEEILFEQPSLPHKYI